MKHKTSSSSLRRLTRDLLQARWLFLLASLVTVDSVLLPQAEQHLMPILGQMLLVIVANTLIQWLNPLLYNQLVYRYSQQLRQGVIKKVHYLPLAYLDRQGTGDLVSRVTTD